MQSVMSLQRSFKAEPLIRSEYSYGIFDEWSTNQTNCCSTCHTCTISNLLSLESTQHISPDVKIIAFHTCSALNLEMQQRLIKRVDRIDISCKTKYYICSFPTYRTINPYTSLHMGQLHSSIIADLSLCLPQCRYQQSPVRIWLERESGRNVYEEEEEESPSTNHPFCSLRDGW